MLKIQILTQSFIFLSKSGAPASLFLCLKQQNLAILGLILKVPSCYHDRKLSIPF